ncbi:FixH family protein [Sporosarcina ureae]|uniref:FixH family protein n=1 Tax=Sporosarcina ureae TaxID=1571 RepID=UPI0026EF819C|nr:FixH family protein [Sporosarcina ureae]
MKRLSMLVMSTAMIGILAGCGQDDDVPTEAVLPEVIDVELTVPEQGNANEPVTLTTLVTQGEEKVDDASEVEYEIWEEGKKEDSILVETTNEKNGIYSAETTFETDGMYHVQVHVTARDMHVMPEKQIQIGDATHQSDGHESAKEGQHHEHGEGVEGLALHFMQPKGAKAATDTELMTHAQLDGEAIKAQVRYEIISADKETTWVDTEESKPGEYTANYQFPKAGSYQVIIHIENEDIHEHEEHIVEVN